MISQPARRVPGSRTRGFLSRLCRRLTVSMHLHEDAILDAVSRLLRGPGIRAPSTRDRGRRSRAAPGVRTHGVGRRRRGGARPAQSRGHRPAGPAAVPRSQPCPRTGGTAAPVVPDHPGNGRRHRSRADCTRNACSASGRRECRCCTCPRRDSNPHCVDFKSTASAGWATGAPTAYGKPVQDLDALANSSFGLLICPSEMTSRRNRPPSSQSMVIRTLRLKVGIALT